MSENETREPATIGEYAASRRALSARQVAGGRRPVRRMAAPPVPVATQHPTKPGQWTGGESWSARLRRLATLEVRTDPVGTVHATRWKGPDSDTVTGLRAVCATLGETWTDERSRLVVFDTPATVSLVAAACKRLLVNGKEAAAQVRFATRLSASSRVAVLTSALSAAYWIPEGSSGDIASWTEDFGLDGSLASEQVQHELTLAALDGVASQRQQSLVSRFVRYEADALHNAGHFGGPWASAAFRAASAAQTAWDGYLSSDPVRVREGLFSGSTSSVVALRTDDGRAVAAVGQPSKLKAGKDVHLFDPADGSYMGRSRLLELSYTAADGIVAFFGTSTRPDTNGKVGSSKGFAELTRLAMQPGAARPLFVVDDGYLPSETNPRWSPWTAGQSLAADRKRSREVPLDILLAGGTAG